MQYTAGSFASTITGWFSWILRPSVHADFPDALFPTKASRSEHTPETVLELVVKPAGSAVLNLSDRVRVFQQGRAQIYILYLCAALLALSVAVILGGA